MNDSAITRIIWIYTFGKKHIASLASFHLLFKRVWKMKGTEDSSVLAEERGEKGVKLLKVFNSVANFQRIKGNIYIFVK